MCSYCGCESIAVVGRFMAEHVDIINMTTELRQACATGEDQRSRQSARGPEASK